MKFEPLVTVYIPTYNRLGLLKRAVSSVLDQSYRRIELIVVDDGSNDGTISYLEGLIEADQRVRYFLNESNAGACFSRNRAIKEARGELITGLDDDDYFFPDRIQRFVDRWPNRRANTVALCSNSFVLTGQENEIRTYRKKVIFGSDLIDSNYIGNQVFTETEMLRDIGGFDIYLPILQDLEAWYRLLGDFGVVECGSEVTYVVDKTHPHERIGTKNFQKIKFALDYISEKHKLSPLECECLRMQILREKKFLDRKKVRFERFIFRPNVSNFLRVIFR